MSKQGMRGRRGTFNTEPVEIVRSTIGQAAKKREEEEAARIAAEARAKEDAAMEELAKLKSNAEENAKLAQAAFDARANAEHDEMTRAAAFMLGAVNAPTTNALLQAGAAITGAMRPLHTGGTISDRIARASVNISRPEQDDQIMRGMCQYVTEQISEGNWLGQRNSTHRVPVEQRGYDLRLSMYANSQRPTLIAETRASMDAVGSMDRGRINMEQSGALRSITRALITQAKAQKPDITDIRVIEGAGRIHQERDVRTRQVIFGYEHPLRHVVISGYGAPQALAQAAARANLMHLQTLARTTLNALHPDIEIVSMFTISVNGAERWAAKLRENGRMGEPNLFALLTKDASQVQLYRSTPDHERMQAAYADAVTFLLERGNSD